MSQSSSDTLPIEQSLREVMVEPTYTLYLVVENEELKSNPAYEFVSAIRPGNDNAGYDLLTAEDWCAPVHGSPAHLLDLGVRAMMIRNDTKKPVHFWLAPRSSIYKTGHSMANSLGVIDASYRGVLKAPVFCWSVVATGFKKGDRHFQILAPDMGYITDIHRVTALPETVRGEGGFGSTGR